MVTPVPRIQAPSAATKGEVFQVKAIISHPMETGLRHGLQTLRPLYPLRFLVSSHDIDILLRRRRCGRHAMS